MNCCSRFLYYKTHDSKQQKPRKQEFSSSFNANTQEETIDHSDSPRSLSQKGNKYDVFLSYNRDEHTQKSFSSRLSTSLKEAGISVARDGISTKLSRSIIKSSRIPIIIFSTHYVSSKECLQELTKIMEFHKAREHHYVIPIFYGMDRCDIQDQQSSFQQAFDYLIRKVSPTEDEVSKWKTAVKGAVRNYGFVIQYSERKDKFFTIDSYDRMVIKNIVKHIQCMLNKKGMFATDGHVGLSSQVQEVIEMLQKHPSNSVASIGIWGMAGIGKTTIAKLIFEHIQYDFESACFLSDVRESWKMKGKDEMQRQLHAELIYHHMIYSICWISGDSNLIERKEIALQSKVLVVVDDVDDLKQLHALCGNRYGKGSRIIITTRNKYILEAFEVNDVFSVKLLSDHVSLELLSRGAFKQGTPEGVFIQHCNKLVAYAEGLPLALQVLGSFMAGKSLPEWEETMMRITNVLLPQTYDKLELSFDSLDSEEKEIFMNIVLFYIGEDFKDVIKNFDGHGCNASERIIKALIDQSLVTIDKNQKLRMHNLLQLMGRQIISEISQNKIGQQGHRYEVFLSFRGEDTRSNFTSHLYAALCNAGIVVFKDDVELSRGNHIKMELLQAIGSSKIAIIIFSKEYAASKWCLEELSTIIELHKSNEQVVLPVFYDVHPSEIRHQTSRFGEAFEDLIQRISPPKDQVSKWRTALTVAGSIAGIVVLGSMDESENVKEIVEKVCDRLDKKDLFVADHPVGMDDYVQEVTRMLQNPEDEKVMMVGIWGMGGIGKTTIAKAIYNEIGRNFESRSYLPKIREAWDKEKDQVSLQNQLLSDICKTTKMKINSIESGKITLRDRLRSRKALVVLDDVDELVQLNALIGSRDCFKPGSVIIITTRNQHLLREVDCDVYPMKYLNERESMELLCWHAFKQQSPKEDFINLSRDIVAYSGGLPLALEVLGSYLFGREVQEWESVLEKLKKIPNKKIQKKLKISFDGLDDLEKEIFLDISCFFIGMDRNDVSHILNGCGFFAVIGIKTLVERSLVTVDENNVLGMHDLLREMGREIIRKQSQKEIGKRSRLWFHDDALAVLLENMGTDAIEGLSLKLSQSEKNNFKAEAFHMMKRLRLLHLANVQLEGDYNYISRDLRWLCWHGFPKKYIPRNFHKQNLVAIDLKCSSLIVWKEFQVLEKLKILNLSHSHGLVHTPNFTQLPNLESLILKDCQSLSMIHDSIGLLDKLLLLDLEDCIGLLSLPRSIYRLKCLKKLIISGCVKIEKLEEDIEQMESLTTLIAPTIKQVPYSLVRVKSLLYTSVFGYEGLSRHVIPSLYRSWISPTNNPLPIIPTHAGIPSPILWDMLNNVPSPSTISCSVPKQQSSFLKDGLEISGSLCVRNCMDILRLESYMGHSLVHIGMNSEIFSALFRRISQALNLKKYSDDCILPGDNYPYWLTFKGEGASVKFKVPPFNDRDHLTGMSICFVHISSGDLNDKACESCIMFLMIINYTKNTTLVYTENQLKFMEETENNVILSSLDLNDQVEVKAIFGNGLVVKNTAVYFIYTESFDEHMEPSTSEVEN